MNPQHEFHHKRPCTICMSRTTPATIMYLNYDDWSPRYDPASFYTVQLQGYVWITSQEQLNDIIIVQQQKRHEEGEQKQAAPSAINTSDSDRTSDIKYRYHNMPTKCRLPTYYYKIIVHRGHHHHVLYRSYIQFEWLYHQLRSSMSKQKLESNISHETIVIPHPLQGSLDNDDKCSFMGYCWIVQQMQELLDFLKQQQFHHQQQQHQYSTMATTTSNSETLILNSYNSTLAETRCQQLSYFLTTVLEQLARSVSASTITSASHYAVVQFLEL